MKSLIQHLSCFLLLLVFTTACPATKEKKETPPPSPVSTSAAPPSSAASSYANPTDAVKSFYDAILNEKYNVAWSTLSKKSQDKFVAMVAEEEKMDPSKIREMFDQNQSAIQLGFWKSFRDSSKIATIAPTAAYKPSSENGNEAAVEMTSGSVSLQNKAYKEGNGWKFGYVETFME